MSETIIRALKTLDTANDEHWTTEGAPRLEALQLAGVKRAEVTAAAPHFSRTNPSFETPASVDEKKREAEIAKKAEEDKALEKDLDGQIADAEADVDKAHKVAIAAKNDFEAKRTVLDKLLRQKEGTETPHAQVNTILEYQKSQNEQRVARAGAKTKG